MFSVDFYSLRLSRLQFLRPRHGIIPQGYQSVSQQQVGCLVVLSLQKGQRFVLVEQTFALVMGLPFLRVMLLAKLPSMDYTLLIQHHMTPDSFASDQETQLTTRALQQWTFDHIPHNPKLSDLIERQNGLWKIPLQYQLCNSSMVELNGVL